MTNLERWNLITSQLGAPAAFLKFAYLAAVSAALERRIFYGDLNRPCFVNNYTLLVGPAGVGKGQSMREVKAILGALPKLDSNGQPMIDRRYEGEYIPLFYQLADSITFEALIESMATQRAAIKRPDNGTIYEHASAYLMLEELSSLLRINKTDDVARLLLNLYDCQVFEYKTKKSGHYKIRNGCLNLIAGTTIDFLSRAEQNGLVGEGLISRMTIVYAEHREFDRFEQHTLTPLQQQYQKELQQHFFRLGHLFGGITYSSSTGEWLEKWWQEESGHIADFGDSKLMDYFSRRKVQMMKLAAAVHFGEALTLEIPLETFMKAAALVRELEEPIIKLARRVGKNSSYSVVERFLNKLRRCGQMTDGEVLTYLSSDMQMPEMLSTLDMLTQSGQIRKDGVLWKPITKTPQ